jgi:hypothetical protein
VADLKDKLLAYGVASSAYYAAAYPIFHAHNGVILWDWQWQLLQYFIMPCLVGVAVVFLDQSDLFYRICKLAGLRVSHHIPAAWDYAFSRVVKGTFVLVRLTDGTLYAGIMGRQSFASTAASERDVLIEQVWSIEEKGPWKVKEPKRSVLLCGRDIRWVEFFDRS